MISIYSRLFFILLYLVIVSQGIFYLFAVSKAFSTVSMDTFAEQRKAIDIVIEGRLKLTYLTALVVGIVVLALHIKTPGSFVFTSTVIAFTCLLADLLIAIKYNLPINAQFHTYTLGSQDLDWHFLRLQWLKFIEYIGGLQIIGFLSVSAGFIYQLVKQKQDLW